MVLACTAWVYGAYGAAGTALAATVEDFDGGSGTPYQLDNCVPVNPGAAPPQILPGGPAGSVSFLRLASTTPPLPISNSIAFDRSDEGAYSQVDADLDFRMTPGNGRADGFGVALLDTEVGAHGTSGPICAFNPPFAPEEPMFEGSLGVGFDIYQNAADPGINHPGDLNDNHVSVHWNNTVVCVADATPVVDLAGGAWIHAHVDLELGAGTVSVSLTPEGGATTSVISGCVVPGLTPYEGRLFVGARSGGETAEHDVDNVAVTFSGRVNTPPMADAGPLQSVNPGDSVTLDGTGSSDPDGDPVTYLWTQVAGTPVVLSDPTSSQPDFVAPAVAADLGFELVVDDGIAQSPPDTVGVTVAPADLIGSWGPVIDAEIVPVHAHLLPTGEVLYWEEGGYVDPPKPLGENRILGPATGMLSDPTDPPFDAFCSGHSFLADGTLLVTGGHDQADGVGLPFAATYDSAGDSWTQLPDMGPSGEGRWYPTSTTLATGDVLVISGSKDIDFTENRLPQIWRPAPGDWLDLTDAEAGVAALPEAEHPLGSRFVLYPRMFLAPDGRVFKADANPSQQTWFLDTSGLGEWIAGPTANFPGEPGAVFGGSRDYGSAVSYEPGKILIVGGGDPPTATAEVIDLNDETPAWTLSSPMAQARRHHNAVLLPDGSVLVVGGTSSPEFNNAADAVLEAEHWEPGSQTWTTLASMERARVYHSIAVLLPDGRVLAGGGGRPGPTGDVEQKNFEVYSPPYLFAGPRPVITSAPSSVAYGRTFLVATPDAAGISDVTWIRLPSVTHAFDQNQRLNRLSFSQVPGGLLVTPPASPELAPPGHYMLFILDAGGVPGEAKVVRVDKHDPDRIGVHRPPDRLFLMDADGSGSWTPATDDSAQMGIAGDVPIIGDWNGDGDDDVGVYRPSSLLFLLDYDESGTWTPATDLAYQLGVAGDVPIIGDWNGDGDDDVGVYRPSDRLFLLDYDESGTWTPATDLAFLMGLVGDLPLIGDWNGDGDDDVGVYRPSNRVFLLDYDESGSWNPGADLGYLMGLIGDLPLAGDWNGDGDDDVGVYRPSNRVFLLDYDEGGTWSPGTDLGYAFGLSGDTPITGKW